MATITDRASAKTVRTLGVPRIGAIRVALGTMTEAVTAGNFGMKGLYSVSPISTTIFGGSNGTFVTAVVRNPGYRGISATFWRALSMVGDASTFQVMGTPYCGKGEPSQIIRVGHAAPVCKFSNVAVFGGA